MKTVVMKNWDVIAEHSEGEQEPFKICEIASDDEPTNIYHNEVWVNNTLITFLDEYRIKIVPTKESW